MPRKYLLNKICKNEECKKPFKTKHLHQETCSRRCGITLLRKREIEQNKNYQVWSCGGGVDSVGVAVLIYQGELPKPDYAIMTDNGYEASYTWDYVNQTLKPKMLEVGVNLHIIKSSDYVNMNIVVNNRVVLPAYSSQNGKVVRFNTQCSGPWKLIPVKRWLREQGVKRCVNWVGISADEGRRVKDSRLKWITYKYPLAERNLSRRDCKRLITKAGWPVPLRSSCIICPQKTDNQWLDLRDDYPDDWDRAVEIERDIHKTHPYIFLHRSLLPLQYAKFKGGG